MGLFSEKSYHLGILVIGDALIDHQYWIEHMPNPGEDTTILSTSKNVGGSAANTAIALAWLGAPTKFYGTIGRDLDGDLILEQMQAVGVDVSGIQFGEITGFTITMTTIAGLTLAAALVSFLLRPTVDPEEAAKPKPVG